MSELLGPRRNRSKPAKRKQRVRDIMANDNKSVDELVIVVHGVGDPDPGETLSLFARSIADQSQPLTEHQEVLWLEEDGDDDRMVNTFSAHVRHLKVANGELQQADSGDEECDDECDGENHQQHSEDNHLNQTKSNETSEDGRRSSSKESTQTKDGSVSLAEVFWGDLSQVKKGTFGALAGLIQIFFGFRYLAYVAADQKGHPARLLQWLGLLISRVIHGPLLGINTVLLALALATGITELQWPSSSGITQWSFVLVGGCIGVCLLGTLAVNYVTNSKVIKRYLFWVSVSSFFLAFMMLMRATGVIPDSQLAESNLGIAWYCETFLILMGIQWFSLVLLLAAMFACWFVALFDHRIYRPAIHAALLLPALSVGAWGLFLPFVWTVMSELLDKLPKKEDARLEHFEYIIAEGNALMGVQIMMALSIGICMALVLFRYTWWREGNTVSNFKKGQRAPRLIVNNWVQFATMIAVVAGMYFVVSLALVEMRGNSYRTSQMGLFLAGINRYAFAPLVPLSIIMFISFQHLRPALDIVGDIVTHFEFRRTLVEDLDEDNSFDLHEVSFREGTLYFSKRDAIQRRMKIILNHFRHSIEGNPKLTIVSHSQGTMVSIEVLNDGELDWIDEKFSEVNLVTMGSPFSHVYQHYFKHFYPPLNELFWSNLRSRLNTWVNVFRIDDFVGTDIDFEPFAEDGLKFSNHPVPSRGHNYYWCDKKVLDVLRRYNICQALHPHCHHPEPVSPDKRETKEDFNIADSLLWKRSA